MKPKSRGRALVMLTGEASQLQSGSNILKMSWNVDVTQTTYALCHVALALVLFSTNAVMIKCNASAK